MLPFTSRKHYLLIVILSFCGLYGSAQKADPYQPDFSTPNKIDNMALVWHDEFNTNGKPNSDNWKFEKGFVRNKELQWYQSNNANCINGVLLIEGKRDTVKNTNYVEGSTNWRKNRKYAHYTSSSIMSQGHKEFKFGRFEIRARIDTTLGSWPAIWTKGISGKWPNCGEIDIMEFYRKNGTPSILANTAYGSSIYSYGTWDTQIIRLSEFTSQDKDWCKKFHIWRMEWDEKFIRLFLDDRLVNFTPISTITNPNGVSPIKPFHQPHFILLNLAIGANGGNPNNSPMPLKYEVDYIRVYQKTNTDVENVQQNKSFKIYPNLVKDFITIQTEKKIEETMVYNISGKKIALFSSKEDKINVSSLPTGYYFVKINFMDGTANQQPFIKVN